MIVATIERPWALDVPSPAEATAAIEDSISEEPVACVDARALARGILVGLAVSVPSWLGIAWLVTRLVTMLAAG